MRLQSKDMMIAFSTQIILLLLAFPHLTNAQAARGGGFVSKESRGGKNEKRKLGTNSGPSGIVNPPFDLIKVSGSRNRVTVSSGKGGRLDHCRPYLAWRYVGEVGWRESAAEKFDELTQTARQLSYVSNFGPVSASVRLAKDENNIWGLSGALRNTGGKAVELARFHYLQGKISLPLAFLELQGMTDSLRLVHKGESAPSPNSVFTKLWQGMGVKWDRLADPVHDKEGWVVSKDTAAFIPNWNNPGWGVGFTGPGTAFGEIGFSPSTNESEFYIGVLLDNIVLDSGETRILEKALLWHGDWQRGLKTWAEATAVEMKATAARPAPVGYCSWYQHGRRVQPADISRAIEDFTDWPAPPGGKVIQIDDGFQVKPGDWGPADKFKEVWEGLPEKITASGSIPGLWLAPTAIHESHMMAKEHPEWLQHLPDGGAPIHFANWGGKTFYLEVDRPEAKEFMRDIIKKTVADGWRYLKLDFTYPLSTARVAYDRKKTSFESGRSLYQLFREASGPEATILACIGEPGRYAIGSVDTTRLGGDVSTKWATVRDNLKKLFPFARTNGLWWRADPDVFFMRREKSSLSEEESYVLTGTLGLFGGVFVTSDFASQWSPAAKAAVREFWNEKGPRPPADQRVLWSTQGQVRAYRVSFDDGAAPEHRIGLYNWGDSAQDISIPIDEVGLDPRLKWTLTTNGSEGFELVGRNLVFKKQPPHSLRIADLTHTQRRR